MDGMEQISSAFSRLPYFSAFSCINMSGICATSRIIQTRWMGLQSCDVSAKVDKMASGQGVDNEDEMLMAQIKLATIRQVEQAAAALSHKTGEDIQFVCVLWLWQLAEGAAKTRDEVGDLVFTDLTTKRWLVIESKGTCECHRHQNEAYMALRGQWIYSLLSYLGYGPLWVHACQHNIRGGVPRLPDGLLEDDLAPNAPRIAQFPGPDGFKPSLPERVLSKVDAVIARDDKVTRMIAKYREECGCACERTRTEMVPSERKMQTDAIKRVCYLCRKTAEQAGVDTLSRCGRCGIARYCSRSCQREHWKTHKSMCVAGQGE